MYYLRPTGQSKDYSLQLLMHSKILGGFAQLDIIFTLYTNKLGGCAPTVLSTYNLVFSTALERSSPFGYFGVYVRYYNFGNPSHLRDISVLSLSNPPGFFMDSPNYFSSWFESSIVKMPHIPFSLAVFGKAFSNQVQVDLLMVNFDPRQSRPCPADHLMVDELQDLRSIFEFIQKHDKTFRAGIQRKQCVMEVIDAVSTSYE